MTRETPDGVDLLRHDASHVMAEAVQELFPGTQVTIGPVIENGFYYDFARAEPFKAEDLEKIEQRMREIVDRDEKLVRQVWERDAAVEYFRKIGEIYKAEIIASIPGDEPVSVYRQGNWLDLCRGPHLPSRPGKLGPKAFKLTARCRAPIGAAISRNAKCSSASTGPCWRERQRTSKPI